MSSEPLGFDDKTEAEIKKLADAWLSARYEDCLADACEIFVRLKDDRESPLAKVALSFTRRSAADLDKKEEEAATERPRIACSSCGKTQPEVRLG